MKNLASTLICLLFFSLTANAQVFNFGNSGSESGWFKLGRLHLPQQGADAEIKVIAGAGV